MLFCQFHVYLMLLVALVIPIVDPMMLLQSCTLPRVRRCPYANTGTKRCRHCHFATKRHLAPQPAHCQISHAAMVSVDEEITLLIEEIKRLVGAQTMKNANTLIFNIENTVQGKPDTNLGM